MPKRTCLTRLMFTVLGGFALMGLLQFVMAPPIHSDVVAVTVAPLCIYADLAVAKTVNNATPNVGDVITYTITVTNSGPNGATGVQLTDKLPTGITFGGYTATQGAYTSTTGLWTVDDINSGAGATLTITATVDSGTCGTTITNIANGLTANQSDPDSTNNQASVAITVTGADLAVTKTVNNGTPNAGDVITYTITVTNNGPDDATGVRLTDVLPAGVTFGGYAATQGFYTSTTNLWTMGEISCGAHATLTIIATVNSCTGSGTITNTAILTADNDPNSNNNEYRAVITPASAHCLYLPIVLNIPCTTYDFSCPEDGWEENRGGPDREYGCIDGEFQMLAINPSQTHLAWPGGEYENYIISATVRWFNGSSIGQKYGLTFGIADNLSSFYTFMITPTTRNYEIRYYNASRTPPWETLYFGNSPVISTGLASNYLSVERLNGKISIAVNNTSLGSITATQISGRRHVGIGVGPYKKSSKNHNADARFDDYQICPLDKWGANFGITSTTGPQGGSVPED